MQPLFTRRKALEVLTLAAPGAGLSAAPAAAAGTPAAAENPEGACVLYPEAVEGPFYFDPKLVRSDIAEGRPGTPLDIKLRIIESGHCTPVANARVDIWHSDAGGIYSGYGRQGADRDVSTKGQTFLRGTQTSDGDGRVVFQSIYPGWYPGRTPHIHVKVFLDAKTVVTGQMYFPDHLTARIYAERPPYNTRPAADTANDHDFIFNSGMKEGGGIVFATSAVGDTITAGLLIAIDTSGAASRKASGFMGWLRRLFSSK